MKKYMLRAGITALALLFTALSPMSAQAGAVVDPPDAPLNFKLDPAQTLEVDTTPGVTQGFVTAHFIWEQPESGTEFTGWTLQITEDPEDWPTDASDEDHRFLHSDDLTKTSYDWTGLKQNTTYYARIAMTTALIDPSDNSTWNWTQLPTWFTTPDVYWTNVKRPVTLTGMNVKSKGAFYFELEWNDAPSDYRWNPAWNLLFYDIEYKKHTSSKWIMSDSTWDPYFLFDNILYHKTKYDFRITTWYTDSRGNTKSVVSKKFSATTDSEGPPAYVLDTHTEFVSATGVKYKNKYVSRNGKRVLKKHCTSDTCAVKISWKKPRDNGGHSVTGYEVRYRVRESGDAYVQVDTTRRHVTLKGLARGVYYEVSIRAVNTLGTLDDNSQYFYLSSKGLLGQLK